MNKDNLNRMLTIGTPQCGAFSAFCGVVLAVLLLTIGLWKTLFIFLFAAFGLFIGLCKDKKGAVRRVINRGYNGGSPKIDSYEDLKNKD